MRAVKYGVTRHQVLGLEAVLATGEVIRTGGKFVKATTGYDLTQLIIGSEGTLALVTEATLQALPAPAHHAPRCSRRSRTLDEVDGRGARDRRQRRRPADPRVHRHADDGRRSPRTSASTSASPRTIKDAALAYLVVVLENAPRRPARRGRRRRSPSCSPSSAPSTCTCCRRAPARALIEAREKAFWVAKAAGADDIIDMVVPRGADPRVHGRGRASSAEAHRLVDRRLRPRRRRQRPPLGVPARRRGAVARCMRDIFEAGHGARRRDLGRARHRHREEAVLPRARGPGEARR